MNNDSIYFRDWSIKKLKDEAISYYESIHVIGCYGSKDLRNLDAILIELSRRGIEIKNQLKFN
jgi:hypothetical protein